MSNRNRGNVQLEEGKGASNNRITTDLSVDKWYLKENNLIKTNKIYDKRILLKK